jgi:tRNA-dihydrouridine synthase A
LSPFGSRISQRSNSNLLSKSSSTPSSTALGENENHRRQKYQQLMDASKLQLAPMMDYTDRHFRHVARLVSNHTLLYTEMVAANALSYEKREKMDEYKAKHTQAAPEEVRQNYSDEYLRRFLAQGSVEPLEGASVLQVGGSNPEQMYEAAQTVMDMTDRGWCDYTAINLNCGCPSPKVAGKGCFGAALMDDAKLVSELTTALHEGCYGSLPITVKCRIGTDTHIPFTKMGYTAMDPEVEYRRLCEFIEQVASNGIVTDFAVHARIAVLQKSFSPADNRKIPPLKYNVVHRLVDDYPELTFTLNGGVDSLSQAMDQFEQCPSLNGIMTGRAWAADPWSFAMADQLLYGAHTIPKTRLDVLTEYGKHADTEEGQWDPARIRRFIVKAVTTLFTGEPNAKRYRIALDEIAGIPKTLQSQGKDLAGQPPISELILNAAHTHLSEDVLLRTPEESYERLLYEDGKRSTGRTSPFSVSLRSSAVAEWQNDRQKAQVDEGMGAYEAALAGDDTSPFQTAQSI